MRRREFLKTATATTLATSTGIQISGGKTSKEIAEGRPGPQTFEQITRQDGQINELGLDSISTLLNENKKELTDDSLVAVWLEETARNIDADDNDDYVEYSDETKLPIVAVDSDVVSFTGMLVNNETNWQRGNEEFVLNIWDQHVDGGTVLWDEGHSQFYDLSKFSNFKDYAENNGYTVKPTTDLKNDLGDADAVVITSPSESFTDSELNELAKFWAGAGIVILHDQSDFQDFDQTSNLNEILDKLDRGFRFNDDQAVDDVVNAGNNYQPLTDEFNTSFNYFQQREGLGLDSSKTYQTTVKEVTDGDTVKADIEGTEESIRVLGIDTPETKENSQFERIQEWEGIEDIGHLQTWSDKATQFGKSEIGGVSIEVEFDENEPVRDGFGRVLGYIYYDKNGSRTNYNKRCIEEGYARVYGSSLSKHEEFWDAENVARKNKTGLWTKSDPQNSSKIRNRDVDDLFLPKSASIRTSSGKIDSSRVPVFAEDSAFQVDKGVRYDGDIPLAAVDESNNLGVIGSPLIDESYEKSEGFDVDTSSYENFVFLTNMIDNLSSRKGDVLIDGGHGQFGASFALSNEDAAYYQRYLEGFYIGFEQVNNIRQENLSRGQALIITTPVTEFTSSEVSAVKSFMNSGGSVILMGCGEVTSDARANLNKLAMDLGTDLRVNEDLVLDDTNNVNDDYAILETTVFDKSYPFFGAYSSEKSVVELIANLKSEDGKISFKELQEAIQIWAQDGTIPGTNKGISFEELQKVIQKWATG